MRPSRREYAPRICGVNLILQQLPFIFSLNFPPRWELKRELGEGFIDLGAAASALAIFEELKLWDEVIRCYHVCTML